MTDDLHQHDAAGEPRKPSNLAPWIVGCSAGCLLLLLGAAALVVLGVRWTTITVDRATAGLDDPEAAWRGLAEIVAVRQRPAVSSQVGSSTPWGSAYWLSHSSLPVSGAFVLGKPESGGDLFAWAMRQADADPSWTLDTEELELQGRKLRAARPRIEAGAGQPGAEQVPALLAIELGRRGARQLVVVLHRNEPKSQDAATPISAEEAEAFLAPFDLGREPEER